MVGTFWLKMQEYSIILSSRPYVHEKPIFFLILGAHFQRDDWLVRFLFLHLSSIFSTSINVELSSFYETYHKLECSLKVTVTKWIPLVLNFDSSIAQYIYFCLVKSTDFFFFFFFVCVFHPKKNYREGKTEGLLRKGKENVLDWKFCSLFSAVESETIAFVKLTFLLFLMSFCFGPLPLWSPFCLEVIPWSLRLSWILPCLWN